MADFFSGIFDSFRDSPNDSSEGFFGSFGKLVGTAGELYKSSASSGSSAAASVNTSQAAMPIGADFSSTRTKAVESEDPDKFEYDWVNYLQRFAKIEQSAKGK